MESFGCQKRRTELLVLLTGLISILAGCASPDLAPTSRTYDAGVDLPAGAGRDVLRNQCLNCHELEALTLFQDFYDRDLWRSLVVSMRANGAVLDDDDVEILATYLARHFGTE